MKKGNKNNNGICSITIQDLVTDMDRMAKRNGLKRNRTCLWNNNNYENKTQLYFGKNLPDNNYGI